MVDDKLEQQISRKTIPNIYLTLVPVALLILLGLVNLWDFTPIQHYAKTHFGSDNSHFMMKRQILWVAIGVVAMVAVKYSYVLVEKNRWLFAILSPLILLLPLMPNTGVCIRGGCRHFHMFGFTVYSGIWAVLLALPALSAWLAQLDRENYKRLAGWGLFAWIITINLLFSLQCDLPMLVLFDVITFGMAVSVSDNRRYKIIVVGLAMFLLFSGFIYSILSHPYKVKRIKAAYAFQIEPSGKGYQTRISLEDVRAGGLTGLGLGSFAKEKFVEHYYVMPYTVTTFMLQVTARQMGYCGIALVVSLIGLLAYCGWHLARKAHNDFERILKIGALMFLLLQAFFSIARTLNLIPLMPSHSIPFFSYGAHVTLAAFVILGVLFSNEIK